MMPTERVKSESKVIRAIVLEDGAGEGSMRSWWNTRRNTRRSSRSRAEEEQAGAVRRWCGEEVKEVKEVQEEEQQEQQEKQE